MADGAGRPALARLAPAALVEYSGPAESAPYDRLRPICRLCGPTASCSGGGGPRAMSPGRL